MIHPLRWLRFNKTFLGLSLFVLFLSLLLWFYIVGNNYWGNFYWGFNPSSAHLATIPHQPDLLPYTSQIHCGWIDGQFYYYIATDPFAIKPESDLVDIPFYRYKRVGQPLIANFLAFCLGQKEVTPFLFALTPLLLVALATFFLASFYREKGLSPFYALVWPLFLSVLGTFHYGIMDATAESLCILGLIALLKQRLRWYVLSMSLCVLSRESFILVPAIAFLFLQKKGKIASLVPIGAGLAWQFYLKLRFGNAFEGTEALVNFPFVGLLDAVRDLFNRRGLNLYSQASGLLLFSGTTVLSLWFFAKAYQKGETQEEKGVWSSLIALSLLPLCFTYVIFGSFSFYLRFIGISLAFLPLGYWAMRKSFPNGWVKTLLCSALFYSLSSEIAFSHVRSIELTHRPPPAPFVDAGIVTKEELSLPPLAQFSGSLQIVQEKVQPFNELPFGTLFCPLYFVYEVEVENSSDREWISYLREPSPLLNITKDRSEGRYVDGSIFVTTEWYTLPNKEKVKTGLRCCLPKMERGEKQRVEVIAVPPQKEGMYLLRIGLEQKGVALFHEKSGEGYVEKVVHVPGKTFSREGLISSLKGE